MILGDRGALYASALLLFTGLEEREELLQSRWGNLREFSLASMSWTCPDGSVGLAGDAMQDIACMSQMYCLLGISSRMAVGCKNGPPVHQAIV